MKITFTIKFPLVLLFLGTFGLAIGQVTTFSYTGASETYVVPPGVTFIQIEASGGSGGNGFGGAGGLGACMQGAFIVTPGDVLTVMVGGEGLQWGNSGGGGGGSGVLSGVTPLIVAGGGGGACINAVGYDAVITEDGVNSSGAGGVGGLGGEKGYVGFDCGWASGGGGFSGDGYGGDGLWDGGALPGTLGGTGAGTSALGGGAGGVNGGCTFTYPNNGAWGCGGGGAGSYGGAGGGGYSGGGGGQYVDPNPAERGGGGGGSYNDGIDQVNTEGCNSGEGSVVITVLCDPLTVVVSDDEICAGEEITLDATSPSGADITWDMGVTDAVPFTPDGIGVITYTATSDDPDECELLVDITVLDTPEVTITVDALEICDGETVTFTEGGDADTYVWDPIDVISGDPYSPVGTGTATYTLTGTIDATGCSSTTTVDVTMHELPAVTANADFTEICLGEEVIFTGGGADSYTWDPATVTDGLPFEPLMLGTATYTVTGTDDVTGCSNTATIDVTVNEVPVVTATADDDEVCEGDEVTLTGGGAATYTWDGGVTDGTPFAPPLGTTTYTVTGATVSGCEATATIDITVHELPTVIANADATMVCEGDEVTLTGDGAVDYVWDLGVTDGVPFAPPVGTTTYTVTGTTAEGCEGTATIDITVEEAPIVTASADALEVCEGEMVTLTGGGAVAYAWDLGVVDGVPFAPPVGTTTYTVTGTSVAGCEGVSTIDITVHATPTVGATSTSTEVCLGESFTLNGTGADSYSWDGGAVDGGTITPVDLGSTTYTVTGTTAEGCEGTASITVVVIDCEPVVPAFEMQSPVCVGDCITLTDVSTGTVAEWNWDFGGAADPATSTEQHPEICLTTAGTYTIQLTTTSTTGTISSTTNTLEVYENPSVTAVTDTIIQVGGDATLVANTASSGGTFEWTPDNDVDCGNCQITEANPEESTTFTVTYTDVNGCQATDTLMVLVNFVEGVGVPTGFSPNGDGNNDVLYVRGFALEAISFTVYNRYGEVVFQTLDQNIGWDGTYRNRDENPGVYTWVLQYRFLNGKSGKQDGNVTLVR